MKIHTATATCRYCDRKMAQSGINALEIATFLRAELVGHVAQAHPEHPHDKVTHLIIDRREDGE